MLINVAQSLNIEGKQILGVGILLEALRGRFLPKLGPPFMGGLFFMEQQVPLGEAGRTEYPAREIGCWSGR